MPFCIRLIKFLSLLKCRLISLRRFSKLESQLELYKGLMQVRLALY